MIEKSRWGREKERATQTIVFYVVDPSLSNHAQFAPIHALHIAHLCYWNEQKRENKESEWDAFIGLLKRAAPRLEGESLISWSPRFFSPRFFPHFSLHFDSTSRWSSCRSLSLFRWAEGNSIAAARLCSSWHKKFISSSLSLLFFFLSLLLGVSLVLVSQSSLLSFTIFYILKSISHFISLLSFRPLGIFLPLPLFLFLSLYSFLSLFLTLVSYFKVDT